MCIKNKKHVKLYTATHQNICWRIFRSDLLFSLWGHDNRNYVRDKYVRLTDNLLYYSPRKEIESISRRYISQ